MSKRIAHGARATLIGEFLSYGQSGAIFRDEDGNVIRQVHDPEGGLVEGQWKTLVKAGTAWHVWGEAAAAPQGSDDIPAGSIQV